MKIDISKPQVRKFGLVLAAILIFVGLLQAYKDRAIPAEILISLGVIFTFSSFFYQPIVLPIYKIMMRVSHLLGWVNTRIILGIIFYFMVTPTGLIMKLLGKNFLKRRIEKNKGSYWEKKEQIEFTRERCEKQY